MKGRKEETTLGNTKKYFKILWLKNFKNLMLEGVLRHAHKYKFINNSYSVKVTKYKEK